MVVSSLKSLKQFLQTLHESHSNGGNNKFPTTRNKIRLRESVTSER
jgi:hypothetical protein